MRTIIFIITFIFISISLYSQLPDEHLKEMVLNNNIKSITQWNHKFKDGKFSKEGYKNAYKAFDENGNIVKEEYYRQGDINQKLSYKYDDNQLKTEYENYDVSNDEVSFRQIIDYNDDGKKIKEERYNGSDLYEMEYKYDAKGNRTEIIKKKRKENGSGQDYELTERRVYNKEGKTTTIEVLTPDDELTKTIVNEYDNDGNLIKFTEYNQNEKKTKQIEYEYNEKQQKLAETKHQHGNFIYEKKFHYNDRGDLVEIQKEEPKEEVFISKVFEYDTNDNVAKELRYEPSADKYSHKIFAYDEEGILQEVEVYYATYDYKIQYKFDYEFF
ncbi:MAG: hypothetical protein R6U04_11195 [Bacteroidales bacterium]